VTSFFAGAMQFIQNEQKDAVRFSWNVLPTNKLEATRMAIPVGCMYTPLKPIPGLMQLPYKPIFCKCGAVLNPYCRVDFMNKIWHCPFCLTRNHFPHHYAEISSSNRPAEIIPNYTTIEYILEQPAEPTSPIFLFVIDTCVIDEELDCLKNSIVQSLMLLPEKSLVGLITFGRHVQVHELSFEDCPKAYVIRNKEYKTAEIASLLGLRPPIAQREKKDTSRFLLPVSECEFQLTSILEDLSKDCWPAKSAQRSMRCTGSALNVAIGLLEATFKDQSARIMMFVGGPPTVGPGLVVSTDSKETIRSHHDLQKGEAPHFKKALTFYEGLAERALANGHIVDVFACSLDQVGLAEMKVCVEKTGGLFVLDDSFTRGVFQGSFKRVFTRPSDGKEKSNDLLMAFSAEFQVLTSRELKVCGVVGGITGLDRKHACISETEIGVGGTCAWKIGGVDPNTTVALILDVVNQTEGAVSPQGYVQIVTRYRHCNGTTLLRVTTVAKTFADSKSEQGFGYIKAGFDQEAAAVLMARYAVWKTRTEYTIDILRWLDRTLIKLVQKFATFKKDDAASFRLAQEFTYYPQFMFHLRRSQFLQVFNSSPDETAFYRLVLLRESTTSALIMIQPTLIAYGVDGPAQPVMLDVSSCAPARILLLDTFFHVVIWYGEQIAKWKQDKVHLNPPYEYLGELFKAPKNDAARAMETRFPTPRFIECVEGGSQERFLKAKLNPSITQSTVGLGEGEPPVFTEDVSLKVFMQHLRRLAVQG